MSTNHHTAIAANASAVNTTFNTPLGALDAKITHTATSYAQTGTVATTVTTALTYYAIASHEVSFTPAYTGQTFLVLVNAGRLYSGTAGTAYLKLRIVDGSNTTVLDDVLYTSTDATSAGTGTYCGGSIAWTAAAGDVGVTRKAKLYVSHSVNGSSVSVFATSIYVVTH